VTHDYLRLGGFGGLPFLYAFPTTLDASHERNLAKTERVGVGPVARVLVNMR